jgi:hypothetical protein
MTDQARISDPENCVVCGLSLDDHWLASCPDAPGALEVERTWDGQPLWSTSTEQERLFAGDAFQQMPGQLPIEEEPERYANGYTRSEFSAGLTDTQLRIMLARYAGPALERARDEAAYRGWTL